MHKGRKRGDRRRPRELYRVNHRIRVAEVRVVLEDGEQLGVLSRDEALRTAQEKGLDLVEITARSNPPVCRIMDYGRFKYEQSKKAKEAKKHASTVELKEIKFRPKTDDHDMDFKIKHVTRFIEDGNKCRLVVIFRGREVVHPKTGIAVLDKVLEATKDIAQVEVRPNLEGKRMIMVIGPKPGMKRKQKGGQQQQSKKKGGGKSKEVLAAQAEVRAAGDKKAEEAAAKPGESDVTSEASTSDVTSEATTSDVTSEASTPVEAKAPVAVETEVAVTESASTESETTDAPEEAKPSTEA